jgi:hypothetical protein
MDYRHLPLQTLLTVWGFIATSEHEMQIDDSELFTTDLSVPSDHIYAGVDLAMVCEITSPLPFDLDIASISVRFLTSEQTFVISTDPLKLPSGKTVLELMSKAPSPCAFHEMQVEVRVNRVVFRSRMRPTSLHIEKPTVTLDLRLPSLLMLRQSQLCVVKILTTAEEIRGGTISLRPPSVSAMQLLDHRCISVPCVVVAPEFTRLNLPVDRGQVSVQYLPCFATCYVLLPIFLRLDQEDLQFDRDELEIPSQGPTSVTLQDLFCPPSLFMGLALKLTPVAVSMSVGLDFELAEEGQLDYNKHSFIEPLALSYEIQATSRGIFLTAKVENCTPLPLTILDCSLESFHQIGVHTPMTLSTGQRMFVIFELANFTDPVKLTVQFSYALTQSPALFTDEVDQMLSQQSFIYEAVITNSH